MNRNSAWRRKMVYLGVIVLMLLPLYLLGQPATGSSDGGGSLARMRSDLNLSLENLGEIDPASESMKLATLGMRGVAATVLWNKAEDFRRHQEWDRLAAALNQIVLLQPHFEKVWEYQSHNLSYNISSEFDDYRQRYKWVKQGTDFLTRGVKLNRREPRLIWYTGWFYGQKLGISDEKTQFRELFRNDTAFHEKIANDGLNVEEALGPDAKPDNWLVGRLWLYYGYELVDSGVPLINKSPMTFYDSGPKWSIRHADATSEEGTNDVGTARDTWGKAEVDWEGFGRRDIMSTEGFTIQLGSVEDSLNQVARIEQQFNELTGDRREKFREEQLAKLGDEVREAFETDRNDRTHEQAELVLRNRHKLVTSMKEVALELPKQKQLTALRLAKEYEQADRYAKRVKAYRQQSNYGYWLERTRAEQDEITVAARKKVYEADALWDEADLDAAKEKYDEAWVLWAKVYDDYAMLLDDDSADDLIISIKRYKRMLDLDELPEDFPLKVFVEMDSEGAKDDTEYARRMLEWREKNAKKSDDTSEVKESGADEDDSPTKPNPDIESNTDENSGAVSEDKESPDADESKAAGKREEMTADEKTEPKEKNEDDPEPGDAQSDSSEKEDEAADDAGDDDKKPVSAKEADSDKPKDKEKGNQGEADDKTSNKKQPKAKKSKDKEGDGTKGDEEPEN